MTVILIILGVFIYLVIGRVVFNSTRFKSPYYDEDDYKFFITLFWPFVIFYQLAKFIGDWINGK